LLTTPLVMAQKQKDERKNVCLIAASYPWIFGPYQAQMYGLSKYLDSTNDYKNIFWHPRIHSLKLMKKGVYKTWDDVRKGLLPKETLPPPDDMELDHLKFVGSLSVDMNQKSNMISASTLSALAKEYDIDVFILLLDSVNYLPDVEFVDAAVVAWVPLHTERLHIGMHDFWTMRNYHAIAALAPFAKESIQNVMTVKNAIGGVPTSVEYVPHFINRSLLEDWASKGRAKVQSLIPSHIDYSTFFVLMQGGNYDDLDRKGWNEAIQAYSIFRQSLPVSANVHLYIHAMESYLVEQDANAGAEAPAAVLPTGVKLSYRLSLSGVKEHEYTLDMTQHQPFTVAALKQRSSLCLHASKAEGFGLNSVECQALGKPVITTNYTAMKDFTKLGTAVHPDQFKFYDHYDLAIPPVKKIVSALQHYYQQHLDILQKNDKIKKQRQDEVQEAREWIDTELSIQNVGSRMDDVIQKAISVHAERREYYQTQKLSKPPQYETHPVYQIIQGEIINADINHEIIKPWILLVPDHNVLKNLKLDYQQIQNYAWGMMNQDNSDVDVVCIPTLDQYNKIIPVVDTKTRGPNTSLPYLLKAHWFHKMHLMSHRRISIVWQSLMLTQQVKQLPEGLSVIERKISSASQEL